MKTPVRTGLCIGVAVLFVLPSLPVAAQEPVSPLYEGETTLDFEPEEFDGNVASPDATLIGGQRAGRYSSLIRVRTGFAAEMVKSVESL